MQEGNKDFKELISKDFYIVCSVPNSEGDSLYVCGFYDADEAGYGLPPEAMEEMLMMGESELETDGMVLEISRCPEDVLPIPHVEDALDIISQIQLAYSSDDTMASLFEGVEYAGDIPFRVERVKVEAMLTPMSEEQLNSEIMHQNTPTIVEFMKEEDNE